MSSCVNRITDTINEDIVIDEPIQEETMDVQIYFSSEKDNEGLMDCRKTEPVKRTVIKTTDMVNMAMEQLFAGPTEAEMANGLAKFNWHDAEMGDYVKRVFVQENTAYVDWVDFRTYEKLFFHNSSSGACYVIPPLEDTFLDFPGIERVIYAFDGDPEAFYEWMQIGCYPEDDICDPTPFQT